MLAGEPMFVAHCLTSISLNQGLTFKENNSKREYSTWIISQVQEINGIYFPGVIADKEVLKTRPPRKNEARRDTL